MEAYPLHSTTKNISNFICFLKLLYYETNVKRKPKCACIFGIKPTKR